MMNIIFILEENNNYDVFIDKQYCYGQIWGKIGQWELKAIPIVASSRMLIKLKVMIFFFPFFFFFFLFVNLQNFITVA